MLLALVLKLYYEHNFYIAEEMLRDGCIKKYKILFLKYNVALEIELKTLF